MKDKPRVRFCWECGKKLYGNHFTTLMIEDQEKILHKSCAKSLGLEDDYAIKTEYVTDLEEV